MLRNSPLLDVMMYLLFLETSPPCNDLFSLCCAVCPFTWLIRNFNFFLLVFFCLFLTKTRVGFLQHSGPPFPSPDPSAQLLPSCSCLSVLQLPVCHVFALRPPRSSLLFFLGSTLKCTAIFLSSSLPSSWLLTRETACLPCCFSHRL